MYSPSDLEDEESLGTEHEQPDDEQEREHLGHGAGEEELERGLRLRDGERGSDDAEQALGAAEDHHHEGVDDVELASSRPGGADHGEGRARDAGDAATEPE